jgi:hypothetical protein
MPKLNQKMRKQVEKSESVSGEFEPMRPGKYLATLNEVEAKNSSAGNPMWVAEFGDIKDMDGESKPGRLWYNLNLPTSDTPPDSYEKGADKWKQYQDLCRGRLKAFYEAFGYTLDSDTDEFVGDQAVLVVGVRTIQNGERAGERTNSVNGVKSAEGVEIGDGDGDEDAADEF